MLSGIFFRQAFELFKSLGCEAVLDQHIDLRDCFGDCRVFLCRFRSCCGRRHPFHGLARPRRLDGAAAVRRRGCGLRLNSGFRMRRCLRLRLQALDQLLCFCIVGREFERFGKHILRTVPIPVLDKDLRGLDQLVRGLVLVLPIVLYSALSARLPSTLRGASSTNSSGVSSAPSRSLFSILMFARDETSEKARS